MLLSVLWTAAVFTTVFSEASVKEETKVVLLDGTFGVVGRGDRKADGLEVALGGDGDLLGDMVAYHTQQVSSVVDAPLLAAAGGT